MLLSYNIPMNYTSWNRVSRWYGDLIKPSGHYYHQHVIIPGVLRLLNLDNTSSLLDVGCGEGVLGRRIPKNVNYTGIDTSTNLIKLAQSRDANKNHKYVVADVTKPLPLKNINFTHAVFILSLQNIQHPQTAIANTAKYLNTGGKLLLVLNHPCFRIPRQSSWGIDGNSKLQFRRINRYFSPLKIPINMHPGEKNSPFTWSFHYPISSYSFFLHQNGFLIEKIEEWISDKQSEGPAARMENFSRQEFPLFLVILAIIK